MDINSPQALLQALAEAQLVSAAQLGALRDTVATQPHLTVPMLIEEIVSGGLISRWQAQQLLAGRTSFFLGKYKLIEQIGEGGMGVVFKAYHAMTGRRVALKVMSGHSLSDPSSVARFEREVRAAAAVNHPNLVTAFDSERVGQTHFLVMEYVEGQDLNAWLKQSGPLPIDWSCECIRQAALGLQHAFERGLIHRDIKPSNLLVVTGKDGRSLQVKILDLGLARMSLGAGGADHDASLTQTGQILGTPDYISPEQAKSTRNADIRSDIFSLGCTLFKILTGQAPWSGGTVMQKLVARTRRDAPSASSLRSEIPPELDAIIAKMLARDPADRYSTPQEVARALSQFAKGGSETMTASKTVTLTTPPPVTIQGSATFLNDLANQEQETRALDRPATGIDDDEETAALHADDDSTTDADPELSRLVRRRKLLTGTGVATALVSALLAGWAAWLITRPAVLVLDWPLDQRAGIVPVARSEVGGGMDGAYLGFDPVKSPQAGSPEGADAGATRFDGLDDTVQIPHNARLQIAGDMTLELWFKRTGDNRDFVRIAGKGGEETRTYSFWQTPGARPQVYFEQTATERRYVSAASVTPLEKGRWYHVAGVVRGDQLLFYLNGVQEAIAQRKSVPATDLEPFTIGGADFHGQFEGLVDEVAIYDRSLKASQIKAHFDTGRKAAAEYRKLVLSSRPVGYWRLGEPGLGGPTLEVDGRRRSLADANPVEFELPPGEHRLRMVRPGYREVRLKAPLARGKRLQVSLATNFKPVQARNDQIPDIWQQVVAEAERNRRNIEGAAERQKALADLRDKLVSVGAGKPLSPDLAGELAAFERRYAGSDEALQASGLWPPMAAAVYEPPPNIGGPDPGAVLGSCGDPRLRHWARATSVAISPDGKQIASGGRDRSVRIWDATDGSPLRTLSRPQGMVSCVAWHPQGKRLAAAWGDDNLPAEIVVWDATSGQVVEVLTGHANRVVSLAFSADGSMLVSGGRDRSLRLWSLMEGKPAVERQRLELPEWTANSVAVSSDGRWLACSVDQSETVQLWPLKDQRAGEPISLVGHSAAATGVAFSPNGKLLATGSRDKTIRLWDVSGPEPVEGPSLDHKGPVLALAFASDGQQLASVAPASGGSLYVWDDLRQPRAPQRFEPSANGVTAMAFHSQAKLLAGIGPDSAVRLWNTEARRERVLSDRRGAFTALAYSPDGSRLATAGDDRSVRLWDSATLSPLDELRGHTAAIEVVAFDPMGRWLASAGRDGTLKLWDAGSGVERFSLSVPQAAVRAIAFSLDGKWLAAGGDFKQLRLWQTHGAEPVQVASEPAVNRADAISFSGDGLRLVASNAAEVALGRWSIGRSSVAQAFSLATELPSNRRATAHAQDPSGRWVVSGDETGGLHFFDANSGRERQFALSAHESAVTSLVFSPDGRRVASASPSDGVARLWDAKRRQPLQTFRVAPPGCEVNQIAFHPSGRLLATLNGNGTLYALRSAAEPPPSSPAVAVSVDRDGTSSLDALNPQNIASEQRPAPEAGPVVAVIGDGRFAHWGGAVTGLGFSADGKSVFSVGMDGAGRTWDASTGRQIHELRTDGTLYDLAISPTANLLAIAAHEAYQVRLWDGSAEDRVLSGQKAPPTSVAFSPDGQVVACAIGGGIVGLWDVATGRSLLEFAAHKPHVVWRLAFSRDGETIASGGDDGTILIWDRKGEVRKKLDGHKQRVEGLAFSPDGQTLASAGHDGLIKLWPLASDGEPATLVGHIGPIRCLSYDSAGIRLATGGNDSTARLWDPKTREIRHIVRGHSGPVRSLAFSPDGQTLATGGDDSRIRLWNAETGQATFTPRGSFGPLTDLAWNSTSSELAVVGGGSQVRWWQADSGRGRQTSATPVENLTALAVSPDGSLTAAADTENAIRVWDTASGKLRRVMRGHSQAIGRLLFYPDGRRLCSGGDGGELTLWDVKSGLLLQRMEGHAQSVTGLACSADGKVLVTGCSEHMLIVRNSEDGRALRYWLGPAAPINSLALSADGKLLAAAAGGPANKIVLWDVSTGKEHLQIPGVIPLAIALSPHGILAGACHDGVLRLWDTKFGTVRQTFQLSGHYESVSRLAFAPDGRHLATANGNGVAYIFRVASTPGALAPPTPTAPSSAEVAALETLRGQALDPIHRPPPDAGPVVQVLGDGRFSHWVNGVTGLAFVDKNTLLAGDGAASARLWDLKSNTSKGVYSSVVAIAASPDGKWLATSDQGVTVHLFERATLRMVWAFNGHTVAATQLAFSPDSRRLVSVSSDRTARIWDVGAGREIHTLKKHGKSVLSVAYSNDGRLIATGDEGGTLQLWDANSGQFVRTLQKQGGPLTSLAFNPVDHHLACADGASVKIWEPDTGELRQSLVGHSATVRAVAWRPDGALLASGGDDQMIRLWPVGGDRPRLTWRVRQANVWALAFHPDGELLASSSSADGDIRLWNVKTGIQVEEPSGHRGVVNAVCLLRSGLETATAGQDRSVRVWNNLTGQARLTLTGHVAPVISLASGPGWLAAGATDGSIRIWDPQTGDLKSVLLGHLSGVFQIGCLSDGDRLVSASWDGAVKVWRVSSATEERTILPVTTNAQAHALAIVPNDDRALVSYSDTSLVVWDLNSGQAKKTWRGKWSAQTGLTVDQQGIFACGASADGLRLWKLDAKQPPVLWEGSPINAQAIRLSGDGRTLLLATNEGRIELWDVPARRRRQWFQVAPAQGRIASLAMTDDGRYLLNANGNGTAYLMRLVAATAPNEPSAPPDPADAQRVADALDQLSPLVGGPLPAPVSPLAGPVVQVFGDSRFRLWAVGSSSLAFTADGKSLLAGDGQETASVWDVESGKRRFTLQGHGSTVSGVAVSSDGRTFITTGLDNQVRLWDAADGRADAALPGHTNHIYDVVASPDGSLAASAGADGSIRVWSVPGGELIRTWDLKQGALHALAFSSDGKRLASAGVEGQIRLWEPSSGKHLQSLASHRGAVNALAFHPQLDLLASAGDDGAIRLWKPGQGKPQAALRGHPANVHALTWSPDGKWLASGGDDAAIRVWDAEQGSLSKIIEGHLGPIYGLALQPQGDLLASLSWDRTIRLWTTNDWRPRQPPTGHVADVHALALSADASLLVTAGEDRTARIWDTVSGSEIRRLVGPQTAVLCAAISPDQRWVAAGSAEGAVRVWSAQSGETRHALLGHIAAVRFVAFDHEGTRLATAGDEGRLNLWDLASGRVLESFLIPDTGITSLVWGRDGETLLVGGSNGKLIEWDLAKGLPRRTLTEPSGIIAMQATAGGRMASVGPWGIHVRDADGDALPALLAPATYSLSLAMTPDGSALFAGDTLAAVHVWNGETRRRRQTYFFGKGALHVAALGVSANGRWLAAAARNGEAWLLKSGELPLADALPPSEPSVTPFDQAPPPVDAGSDLLVNRRGPMLTTPIETNFWHSQPLYAVAASPDGALLAAGGGAGEIRLWTHDGALHAAPPAYLGLIYCLAFNSDGSRLAAGDTQGRVGIWGIAESRWLNTLAGPAAQVSSVAFSPDGQRLAVASSDKHVRIWNWQDATQEATLGPLTAEADAVAYSPNGATLASGESSWTDPAKPGLVRLWSAQTGKPQRQWNVPGGVVSLAFSRDGARLASGGRDRTVRIWDPSNGKQLMTMTGPLAAVTSVAFDDSGEWLAAASQENVARIWNVRTGKLTHGLRGHSDQIWSVAFSPSNKAFVTSSWDRSLRLWDSATGQESPRSAGRSPGSWGLNWLADGRLIGVGRQPGEIPLLGEPHVAPWISLPETGSLRRLALSPNGRWLAGARADFSVMLWDTFSQRERPSLAGHAGAIRQMRFSADSRRLATTSDDLTVKLWDVASGLERNTWELGIEPRALAFDSRGEWLAAAGLGEMIYYCDPESGEAWPRLPAVGAAVHSLAASSGGKGLASGGADGWIRVNQPAEQRSLAMTLRQTQEALNAVTEPARRELWSERAKAAGNLKLPQPIGRWEFEKDLRDSIGQAHGLPYGPARIAGGRLLLDGREAYVKTAPLGKPLSAKTLEVWVSPASLRQTGGVMSACTSDGGEFDGISFGELAPRRWLASSLNGSRSQDLAATDETVDPGQFTHIAVVHAADGGVTAYRDGKPYGKPYVATPCELSPAGYVLFGLTRMPAGGARHFAGAIERAQLYDRALTAKEIAASAAAWRVASADVEARLSAAARDQRLKLLAELERQETELAEPPLSWLAHGGAVVSLDYRPDGEQLASVGADGAVRLWDPHSGSLLATYRPATGLPSLEHVAFSPDGRLLAVAAANGETHVLEPQADTRALVLACGDPAGTIVKRSPGYDYKLTVGAEASPWPNLRRYEFCWFAQGELQFELTIPSAAAGTLRLLFVDDAENARRQKLLVEDREIGEYERLGDGTTVDVPVSTEDTADGKLNVRIVQLGPHNAVITGVEFLPQ